MAEKISQIVSVAEKISTFVISRDAEKITIGIGGENKRTKGSDYVIRDNTDYPAGKAIPLWLIAMMW